MTILWKSSRPNKVAGLWDDPCKGFLIKPPRDNVYIFVMVGLWTSSVYSELLPLNDFAKIHPKKNTHLKFP